MNNRPVAGRRRSGFHCTVCTGDTGHVEIFESTAVNGVGGGGGSVSSGKGAGRGASYFLASAKHLAAGQARRILGRESLPSINCQL